MSKVLAICISKHKGTLKNEVSEANFIEEFGIEGDAHAGKWHRQVSLLAFEKIDDFRNKGGNVDFGAFGENLVVDGIELHKLPVGQQLQVGEVLLEVTQIGKECHDKCAIYYQVGECIMPKNGIFTRVLKGGKVKVGDKCTLIDSGKKILSL
ncbi:MOSC domain-containing protein [uncultured Clostridium sp.]|uniref:MOSC domain-containing protein n=1 Tax=Clostridium sp. TaxID=1506 RepID=UPI002671AB24|nr:MOSC domain-containing protein [uncultured Clostridium sp.]